MIFLPTSWICELLLIFVRSMILKGEAPPIGHCRYLTEVSRCCPVEWWRFDEVSMQCFGLASFVVMMWDHLLTLSDEVRFPLSPITHRQCRWRRWTHQVTFVWHGRKGLCTWLLHAMLARLLLISIKDIYLYFVVRIPLPSFDLDWGIISESILHTTQLHCKSVWYVAWSSPCSPARLTPQWSA